MANHGKLFTFAVHTLLMAISIVMLIPFLLVVSISFSNEQSIVQHGYSLIPSQWDLTAYRYIFKVPQVVVRAYLVTVTVTCIGVLLSLTISSLTAYVISRRDYAFRRVTTFYIFFTMLFNGGLVPFYILMTQILGLKDTLWALILPGLLSAWNVMILKAFLGRIPVEIIESAKMDGAKEWRIYMGIIVPLSMPAMATMGLLISFTYWNEWFNALLFIDNQKYVPLQLLLVRMMNSMEILQMNLFQLGVPNLDIKNLPSQSARMAMVVVAAGPMLVVFPFFQKFFVQGLTLGSLKG
ncbi:MAG: carbohydrate ABC transporter permease [Paenibacillaceae bacterium]|nr:carbohydrate ABC transporter permease [Paenibacillaceae bacterium]